MENSLRKLVGLVALVDGTIHSRKKLHKMVYLLQELGEDFDQDFTFHNYGVFSPSLARDLDFAGNLGLLHQSREENQYIITVERDGTELEEPSNIFSDDNIVSAANRLQGEPPQFLEVLSTIVYLYRGYYRGNALKKKLMSLKGDLSIHYNGAYQFARELYGIEV